MHPAEKILLMQPLTFGGITPQCTRCAAITISQCEGETIVQDRLNWERSMQTKSVRENIGSSFAALRHLMRIVIDGDKSSRDESMTYLTNALKALEIYCIENSDAAGPTEPNAFKLILEKSCENEIADIFLRRVLRGFSSHPVLKQIERQWVEILLSDFCKQTDFSAMKIDEFSVLLSSHLSIKVGCLLTPSTITYTEAVFREAIGQDGRIPNDEFAQKEIIENAKRVIQSVILCSKSRSTGYDDAYHNDTAFLTEEVMPEWPVFQQKEASSNRHH